MKLRVAVRLDARRWTAHRAPPRRTGMPARSRETPKELRCAALTLSGHAPSGPSSAARGRGPSRPGAHRARKTRPRSRSTPAPRAAVHRSRSRPPPDRSERLRTRHLPADASGTVSVRHHRLVRSSTRALRIAMSSIAAAPRFASRSSGRAYCLRRESHDCESFGRSRVNAPADDRAQPAEGLRPLPTRLGRQIG